MGLIPWLDEARKYNGMNEFDHEAELKALFDFVDMKQDGKYPGNADPDDQPWCAQFVSAVLAKCGIQPSSQTWWARSYLEWGRPLSGPSLGAIVIFERGAVYGHVGLVVGKKGRSNNSALWVLGGNQDNQVKVSPFQRRRVLGYRFPKEIPLSGVLLPVFTQEEEFSQNES